MASEIRKVGEPCPYRVGGRRHATLHPDVTFRHEDHSTCPADPRPGPRPHHRPSRSSPAIGDLPRSLVRQEEHRSGNRPPTSATDANGASRGIDAVPLRNHYLGSPGRSVRKPGELTAPVSAMTQLTAAGTAAVPTVVRGAGRRSQAVGTRVGNGAPGLVSRTPPEARSAPGSASPETSACQRPLRRS
jgi:hypothetical protein